MPMFIPDYDSLFIHKSMLRDQARTAAYIAAIAEVVKPGAVVVDLGTGTGILSLAAARAGAGKVFAFERARIVELARRNFTANFPAASIEVIAADSRAYGERGGFADVLVSEWLGVHALQENMLSAVIDARRRFLRPPGIMVPYRVGLWLAPLRTNARRAMDVDDWRAPFFGFDLSEIARLSAEDPLNFTVHPSCVIGQGQEGLGLDMRQVEDRPLYRLHGSFAFPAAETVEAICGWFTAELAPRVRLDTSPFAPRTHWEQAIYPFAEPIGVAAGETLSLSIDVEPHEGYSELSWRGHVVGRQAETEREHSTRSNYLIAR